MTNTQRDEILLRLAELVAEMARVVEDNNMSIALREARQELEGVLQDRQRDRLG